MGLVRQAWKRLGSRGGRGRGGSGPGRAGQTPLVMILTSYEKHQAFSTSVRPNCSNVLPRTQLTCDRSKRERTNLHRVR